MLVAICTIGISALCGGLLGWSLTRRRYNRGFRLPESVLRGIDGGILSGDLHSAISDVRQEKLEDIGETVGELEARVRQLRESSERIGQLDSEAQDTIGRLQSDGEDK